MSRWACINGLKILEKMSKDAATYIRTKIVSKDQPLGNESHRPILCHVYWSFQDDIWCADLVDMQLK